VGAGDQGGRHQERWLRRSAGDARRIGAWRGEARTQTGRLQAPGVATLRRAGARPIAEPGVPDFGARG
jgi:hypothetical protein